MRIFLPCLLSLILLNSASANAGALIPAGPISSTAQLCESILSGLDPAIEDYSDQPLNRLLTAINLMMDDSSYLAVSSLKYYEDLGSLHRLRRSIREIQTPNEKEVQRKGYAVAFLALFEGAPSGDDVPLAKVIDGYHTLVRKVLSELFFYRPNDERMTSHIFSSDQDKIDTILKDAAENWNKLSPTSRRNLMQWLGQVFTETSHNYVTTSFKFDDLGKAAVSVQRMLPEIALSFESYRDGQSDEALSEEEQRAQYHRLIGAKLFSIFGLQFDENESVQLKLEDQKHVSWRNRMRKLLNAL